MFTLPTGLPNGTVLLLGVSYEDGPPGPSDTRGISRPKVFTYAALKTGGLWYLTGAGKSPTAAGWGAVEKWLARDGRKMEWVKQASRWDHLWPVGDAIEAPAAVPVVTEEVPAPEVKPEHCPHHPDDPGAGDCPFDSCRSCGGYHCGWECPDMTESFDDHGVSGYEL